MDTMTKKALGNLGIITAMALEPCPMCAGAILMPRVGRVIFGAPSPKCGAAGSRADWLGSGRFPHKPEVIGSLLAPQCAALLTQYFHNRRHLLDQQNSSHGA